MRFVIDAQLSPALVKLITAQGYEADHVQYLNLKEADDTRIWNYALENNAIVITKDDDFAKRFRLSWFEPLLPRIIALIEEGERLIEVR